MKRLAIFCVIALAVLPSCNLFDTVVTGNGVRKEATIVAKEFDAISLDCSMDVIYSQTPGEQSITFICDENLAEYYRIEVDGSTLKVDTKPGVIKINSKVKASLIVNSSEIKNLSVSGSGDIQVTSPITSPREIKFSVSGSGDIDAEGMVNCDSFSSSVSGSGDIDIQGVKANEAQLKVSGSGSTEIDGITARNISVSVSGSGGVELVCKDAGKIDVSISGSGGVKLSGTAQSVNSKTTGSGKVNTKDLSTQ